MAKKAKKTKKTAVFMKFKKWLVTSIKKVTLAEWVVFIWTITKVVIELAQTLSIKDRVILFIGIILQCYNWISNINDFVFGITTGMISFVICISGALIAFSHLEIEERFLTAPPLFVGLFIWGAYLAYPTGPWLQGSAVGAFMAWGMSEALRMSEDNFHT